MTADANFVELFPLELLAMIPQEIRGTVQEPNMRKAILQITESPLCIKYYIRLQVISMRFIERPVEPSVSIRVQALRVHEMRTRRIPTGHTTQVQETFLIGPIVADTAMAVHVDVHASGHTTCLAATKLLVSSLISNDGSDVVVDREVNTASGSAVAYIKIQALVQRADDFTLYAPGGIFAIDDAASSLALLALRNSICTPSDADAERILALAKSGTPVDRDGRVTDLGNGLVLKRSYRALAREAIAMEFIRKNTSIPVPKVHMYFRRDGEGYIVMDKVDGVSLAECSSGLTDSQWDGLLQQLHSYVDELQRLPHPTSTITFGAWPSGPYISPDFEPIPNRPWKFPEEVWSYWFQRSHRRPYPPVPRPDVFGNPCRPVLSHGDLQMKNVLVRDACVVSVVDWETLGFYPDVWEWVAVKSSFPPEVVDRSLLRDEAKKVDAYEDYVRSMMYGLD
ncbi:hypothetical protein EXIGLDRAFT_842135 [Exidia glandulosa HHB12029]|uniref:Aminoglycoside phosphotransferase domain-containing protein n=1 Tax=Exidia glandulosa HHB12029 TaxID=1314781 RepID=A0A165DH46_EXIGL|nr:hypothetical protein EXIGLDRAFT_842135 [Exidia glandulosa HHB12029]